MTAIFYRFVFMLLIASLLLLPACASATVSSTQVQVPTVTVTRPSTETPASAAISTLGITPTMQLGFMVADGSRPLIFPADFGAHPDFRTEWWYYTGNLQTAEGRHFGFELTIFRVGLLPPTAQLPNDSNWSSREIYFANFAVSDIGSNRFYAFQRYSRDGVGL